MAFDLRKHRACWRRCVVVAAAAALLTSGLAAAGAPLWFQRGTTRRSLGRAKEASLLRGIGKLLMPQNHAAALFRELPTEAEDPSTLVPGLSCYGALEAEDAALFVEYDGGPRHLQSIGIVEDEIRTEALLQLAPPGSYVVRIAHAPRSLDLGPSCVEVVVDPWKGEWSFQKALHQVVQSLLQRLDSSLRPSTRQALEEFSREATRNMEMEPPETWLKQVRLHNGELARLLEEHPHVVGFNLSKGNLSSELRKLTRTGLTKAQLAKIIAERPRALGLTSDEDFEDMLAGLKKLGLSEMQVAEIIQKYPLSFRCDFTSQVKPAAEWLGAVGLNSTQIAVLFAKYPQVWRRNIKKLRPRVDILRDCGLNSVQIAKTVMRSPRFLAYSEEKLRSTMDFFEREGFSRVDTAKLISSHPPVLSLNVASLPPKMAILEDLGLRKDLRNLMVSFPQLLDFNFDRQVLPVVSWLNDMGLSKERVRKLILRSPPVLGVSIDRLRGLATWLREMGLSDAQTAKVMTSSPRLLSCSVDENLKKKVELIGNFFEPEEVKDWLARHPRILGWSHKRLNQRLATLQSMGMLHRTPMALRKTDQQFESWTGSRGLPHSSGVGAP